MMQPGFTFDDGYGHRWMVQQAQVNSLRDGSVTTDLQCVLMGESVPSAGSGTVQCMAEDYQCFSHGGPVHQSGDTAKENVRRAEERLAQAKAAHKLAKRQRREAKAERKRKAAARALAIETLKRVAEDPAADRLGAADRLLQI